MARARPPSVDALLEALGSIEDRLAFEALVRRWLPAAADQVLVLSGVEARTEEFARLFSERYFPLHDGPYEEYADLLSHVPAHTEATSIYELEQPADFRPGLLLLMLLVKDPLEEVYTMHGARVAAMEEAARHVPQELLDRLPEDGYDRERLHQLLDGGPYEAAAIWADVLYQDTGVYYLDIDESEGSVDYPSWSEEDTLTAMAEEYQEARRLWEQVTRVAEHIEEAPEARFAALLAYIDRVEEVENGQQHLDI